MGHYYFSNISGFENILQCPGKPYAKDIKSDSLKLMWDKPQEKADEFQIRYKLQSKESKWRFIETYVKEDNSLITGLVANGDYIFQVRGIYKDEEGPYGPLSDTLKTQKSSATSILEFCVQLESGQPSTYQLPVNENKAARNEIARTRKLVLGNISTL